MANATGPNSFDQQNDVDAYLEAFISDVGSVNPEPNPRGGPEWFNPAHHEVPSPRPELSQRLDASQNLKDLPPARDEMQQLRRFLEEAQAKNQARKTPPPPSRNKLKRGFKFAKTILLIVGVSFVSINFYEYYQSCRNAGNCPWKLVLTFPQPKTTQTLQSTVPQIPQTSLSDPFQEGVRKATNAVVLAKTAQNRAEWDVITEQWLESIKLMNSVPPSSSSFALAQQKVREYIDYLTYAAQQAKFAASQDGNIAPTHASELPCPKEGNPKEGNPKESK